ncbi:MAG: CHRD domain-containing protein, partial [Longimicrobiales bacterium]
MNARKSVVFAIAALAIGGIAACSEEDEGPQPEVFVATLNGQQEVPAVTTAATGTGRVEFTTTGLTFTVSVANIANVTAAHIHASPTAVVGVNGGVVLNIISAASTVTNGVLGAGSATATNPGNAISMDSLKVLIRGGRAYFNVHNTANPG